MHVLGDAWRFFFSRASTKLKSQSLRAITYSITAQPGYTSSLLCQESIMSDWAAGLSLDKAWTGSASWKHQRTLRWTDPKRLGQNLQWNCRGFSICPPGGIWLGLVKTFAIHPAMLFNIEWLDSMQLSVFQSPLTLQKLHNLGKLCAIACPGVMQICW